MSETNATIVLPLANISITFSIQLVATLIGAFVGFGLVIWWDRKKKKGEREETKNSMLNSIFQELTENQEGLNNMAQQMPSWNKTDGRFKGDFGLASTPAFESAVSAGDFLLLSNDLQKPVREVYHNFELYNEFMKEIMRFSSFHFQDEQASIEAYNLINRLQERINILRPVLSDLLPKLKSAT